MRGEIKKWKVITIYKTYNRWLKVVPLNPHCSYAVRLAFILI